MNKLIRIDLSKITYPTGTYHIDKGQYYCSCEHIQECFSNGKKSMTIFNRLCCVDKAIQYDYKEIKQNTIYIVIDSFLNRVNRNRLDHIQYQYLLFNVIENKVIYYSVHEKFHDDIVKQL